MAYLQDILDCPVCDAPAELRQETSQRVVEKRLTNMHNYKIHIQHQGGLYRLGTISDAETKAILCERISRKEELLLYNRFESGSIYFLDHQNILSCGGPHYANAQITIYESDFSSAMESYMVPDQPDCMLSSLETETPFLDLDKLEVECPEGLVFGGYASYANIAHVFSLQTDQPFDRAALFFGVVNLVDLFGDVLVVTHAYYLSRKHRIRLGQLAFPGEGLSDAFIYEELENIYEKGKNGQEEILQVLESSRINPIDTKMGQLISEHPYLYRVDGTPLYPKP